MEQLPSKTKRLNSETELELYRKHRPKLLKEMIGQDTAVKTLQSLAKQGRLPHAMIISGPSGTGKTTLARIIRNKLKCGGRDFEEINGAKLNGIEMVRGIGDRMGFAPLAGKSRVWLIDEAHQMTTAAQNGLLKMLEDPPSHAYFLLATTDPQRLIKTVQNRCTRINVTEINSGDMATLLKRVTDTEGIRLTKKVITKIIVTAAGSPRSGLVLLHTVAAHDNESDQLDAIAKGDFKGEAIAICRALMKPSTKWSAMSVILKEIKAENPEGIRRLILAYFTTVLLGGGANARRAHMIINAFNENFYDTQRTGLVSACFEVVELSG